MRRRALLTSIGVSSAVLTTGCLGSIEDRLDTSIQLGRLAVHNYDTEAHRFELRVTRNGTRAHQSTYDVPPSERRRENGQSYTFVHGDVAECDWGPEPGEYAILARVDGGDWITESLNEVDARTDAEVDCATARVVYTRGERYSFDGLWITPSAGCDRGYAYDGMCSFTSRYCTREPCE